MSYNTLSELMYDKTIMEFKPEEESSLYNKILESTRDHINSSYSELAAIITNPDLGTSVRKLISNFVKEKNHRVPDLTMAQLTDKIYGDMVGFGFLEEYIHNPEVEEINGNSWRDIEIVKADGWFKLPIHFSSPQRAVDTIRKMARLGGLVLDASTPIIDSYLTKGVRLSAAIPPVVDEETGVVFSLRRQRMTSVSAQALIDWETATKEQLDFMVMLVNHGVSVTVAGATSSGKTTDISFILNNLDLNKRIYTIEETRELDLTREDDRNQVISRVVHLCTREGSSEKFKVSSNLLLRHALRFHPDIIVPAEMRGEEAMTAQEAARTGHAIVSTLHANSAKHAYGRIMSMCRMSDTRLEDSTLMRFIVEAFPIMIYKKQLPNGKRKIMEIVEAVGVKDDQAEVRTIYRYDIETDTHTMVNSISDALAQRLRDDGVDAESLSRYCRGADRNPGRGV